MPKATILVVDDEALIRWSLTERLHAEGYEVLEAGTGKGALEKLPEGVDLVLLDYRLPDTDGVSVLRKIKEFEIVDGVVLPASLIMAIFLGLTVMQNWQMLQEARAVRRGYREPVDDYDDRSPWER